MIDKKYFKVIGKINFTQLRMNLYEAIHNPKTKVDDLIYMWDFFKEHEVVTLHVSAERFKRKNKN